MTLNTYMDYVYDLMVEWHFFCIINQHISPIHIYHIGVVGCDVVETYLPYIYKMPKNK